MSEHVLAGTLLVLAWFAFVIFSMSYWGKKKEEEVFEDDAIYKDEGEKPNET